MIGVIVLQLQQVEQNKMKAKQIKFKNPFELMEDDEAEGMVPQNDRTNVGHGVEHRAIHTPLPFNPYQVNKIDPKKKIDMMEDSSIQVNPKKIPTHSPTFAQPFAYQYKAQPAIPNQSDSSSANSYVQSERPSFELDENGDPPLLQDIGIDLSKIKERVLLIVKVKKPDERMTVDPDLFGPVLIALIFGCLLLFSGKIHFGDIYMMFIVGNLLIFTLFNFMSQVEMISLYNIMSTLGYGLLPMLVLGFIGIFTKLNGAIGIIVALLLAIWASTAAGNIIESLMKDTRERKLLVIYPLFLFYTSFSMIVIF